MLKTILLSGLGLILLLAASPAMAGPHIDSLKLSDDDAALLKRTAGLLKAELSDKDLDFLVSQAGSTREPVNMMATVVLYKHDPKAYEPLLYGYFSVRDYEERAKGKYNMIGQDEFVETVKKIDAQLDEEMKKLNLLHLFVYWYFRDRNEWFKLNGEDMSTARFFRSSSLSAYLGMEETEVVLLAARIDQAAQKHQLEKK
jgi:hypothetical protein